MFKKLLSNLSFNPSLIGQVSFYAKRMHREEAIRRTGLVFVVLALVVQLFAAVSPPEQTLAASNNDIVHGGFTTREQAVNYCRSNTQDFANTLAYYKISCETLAGAATKTIRSTDRDYDSLGRVPQGPTIARTGKATDEYSTMINGTEYFMRNLRAWDSGAFSTYKVLEMKNTDGVTIMVMFSCANLVTIGKYTPPPRPTPPKTTPPVDACPKIPGKQTNKEECDVCVNVPGEQSDKSECYPCPEAKTNDATTACLELSKTAANQTQNLPNADNTLAMANDILVYSLTVKNKGSQAVKAFVVEENLNDVLEYADIVDLGGGKKDDKHVVRWDKQDIAAGQTIQKKITVRVKDPVPQTPVSATDPSSFDLIMTNVYYGTAVHIKLPASTAKSTEVLVATLPNTGPGTTIAIGVVVVVFASYFFARSRLMAKELDIVKRDYASSGGM